MPDVDIDFFDRDGVLKLFKHTPATIIKDDKVTGEESQMKAGYGQTKGLLYYKYIK